jgi:hypothetical protein
MTTDTLIHQYTDADGDIVSIWHNTRLADSLAFLDFKLVYAETILNKFSSTTFLNAVMNRIDRIEVIYTVRNNEVLLGGAFEHNTVLNEVYMVLAFVPDNHRGSFFAKHRLVQDKIFKDLMLARGVTQLVGWINVNNTKALKVFERRGFAQESIKVVRQL